MSQFTHGMNPAVVREQAGRMDAAARELRAIDGSIEQVIAGLERQWTGPDLVRFKGWWRDQHKQTLHRLVDSIEGLARSARYNADDQDRASEGGDGGAGSSVSTSRIDALKGEIGTLGHDPARVADWWRSLSDAERAVLVHDDPGRIGNLDGIAFEDRFEANRLNIERHVAWLESTGASADHMKHFRELIADDSRNFVLFDPSGDGRIAEVFGDLTNADDIAIVVPGIGNDLAHYSPDDAESLLHAMGDDSATIMWLGYDTPSGPWPPNPLDPAMLRPERAIQWAPDLTSFTNGIRASAHGEISIVAHSYGTILATEAAKGGMSVERIVLMGSPGVRAESVSEFNGAHVFAVRNQADPVPLGNSHGTDPTDSNFGATELKGNDANFLGWGSLKGAAAGSYAGPVGAVAGGYAGAGLENHGNYLDGESTSLTNVAAAIKSARISDNGLVIQRIVHDDGSADEIWTATF